MNQHTDHGLPGIYNGTVLTMVDGTGAAIALNISGQALTDMATLIAGEDLTANLLVTEQRYTYANITTATTTTIKSGAGFFHTLTINTPVASSVITIYDNTAGSGTKIGTVTLPATLLMEGPNPALYDVSFGTGLTIVTATGASDITVAYR